MMIHKSDKLDTFSFSDYLLHTEVLVVKRKLGTLILTIHTVLSIKASKSAFNTDESYLSFPHYPKAIVQQNRISFVISLELSESHHLPPHIR